MEGITLGISDEVSYSSNNIFAVLMFKHDDMTGYWPYKGECVKCSYTIEKGIPTMSEELPLSAKCLIKW